MSTFRQAIADIVPYEPGKPIEEVHRELGLEQVVKLASNESPFPPFPAALEAIERTSRDLNRYPDGGAYRLRTALAELHGVAFEEIVVAGGADAVIDLLSQAMLDEGDEVVCGWPSFLSYANYALKLGAVPVKVPLRDHVHDLDAMLEAVGPRTKLVYLCHPNNPTGTMNGRAETLAFLDALPEHVLCVLDQAYFEFVVDDDYADGIAEAFRAGRRVLVLRTFSKIHGLAGLRIGYGVGPADVVTATSKVRRAFDMGSMAQEAALASLDDPRELARRQELNRQGRDRLDEILRAHGFDPPQSFANFLYFEVDEPRALFERLLREGVIVRPLDGFGASAAIRVSVGSPEENEFFAAALARVLEPARR